MEPLDIQNSFEEMLIYITSSISIKDHLSCEPKTYKNDVLNKKHGFARHWYEKPGFQEKTLKPTFHLKDP